MKLFCVSFNTECSICLSGEEGIVFRGRKPNDNDEGGGFPYRPFRQYSKWYIKTPRLTMDGGLQLLFTYSNGKKIALCGGVFPTSTIYLTVRGYHSPYQGLRGRPFRVADCDDEGMQCCVHRAVRGEEGKGDRVMIRVVWP